MTTFNDQVTVHYGASVGQTAFLVQDSTGDALFSVVKGAAEGSEFGSVYIPRGDILNVRNIQGGVAVSGRPDLLNLDLGAGNGSSGGRGNIVLNWDVGRGFCVFDGDGATRGDYALVASFNRTWDNVNGDGFIRFFRQLHLYDRLDYSRPKVSFETSGYGKVYFNNDYTWNLYALGKQLQGTEDMVASDKVIVSGKGLGGNYVASQVGGAHIAKFRFYDTTGKLLGYVPIYPS